MTLPHTVPVFAPTPMKELTAMSLAATEIALPESIDLPVIGEMRIDPSDIDADLLRRMNEMALDLAVQQLEDAARVAIDLPARTEEEFDANALKAAHLMLAATLTRNGAI